MLSAHGTVTIRPKEVIPIYREEWDATVTDYKYNLVNRDFVSRNGNLYQVKVQKPKEFVPAGIDPDSEVGELYWQAFNKLSPSVTNFLVIIDEDGKPQTLLSGGRIQTKFLNIGSLNMSETRLWGGAEPMTGKGLALINDPGDRKFAVYNDSKNYVEMFQRENEWGVKGVINGSPVFQFGSTNKIGPFSYVEDLLVADNPYVLENGYTYNGGLELANNHIYFKYAMGSIYQQSVYMGVKGGAGSNYGTNSVLVVEGGDIWHQAGLFYASDIRLRGDMNVDSGSIINIANGSALKSGITIHTMSGKNPNITLSNKDSNIIYLRGSGDRKKINLSPNMTLGTFFIIASETSFGYDVLCGGSERFYRDGNNYVAVQSSGHDPVLVIKVDTYKWVACHMPINWLETWNP